MNGVVYVAYGVPAHNAAKASIQSLLKYNKVSITIIGDKNLEIGNFIEFNNPGFGARFAKLNIDQLVDYEVGLYLDADTLVNGNIQIGFKLIEDGWDFAIAPSTKQGNEAFYHLGAEEKKLMSPFQLQLQAGVFFYHKERCNRLFEEWRNEWRRWKSQDQGALIRALDTTKPRVYLLGRSWNGGRTVQHNFGMAR